MIDFDEWFKNRHKKTGLYEEALCGKDDATYIRHEMRKSYLAGQKSQQAKIEDLSRKVESNLEINKNLQNMVDELIDERDELQKKLDCCREENKAHLEKIDELQARIDEAMKYVSESPLKDVSRRGMINFMGILKGNKDEN